MFIYIYIYMYSESFNPTGYGSPFCPEIRASRDQFQYNLNRKIQHRFKRVAHFECSTNLSTLGLSTFAAMDSGETPNPGQGS